MTCPQRGPSLRQRALILVIPLDAFRGRRGRSEGQESRYRERDVLTLGDRTICDDGPDDDHGHDNDEKSVHGSTYGDERYAKGFLHGTQQTNPTGGVPQSVANAALLGHSPQ